MGMSQIRLSHVRWVTPFARLSGLSTVARRQYPSSVACPCSALFSIHTMIDDRRKNLSFPPVHPVGKVCTPHVNMWTICLVRMIGERPFSSTLSLSPRNVLTSVTIIKEIPDNIVSANCFRGLLTMVLGLVTVGHVLESRHPSYCR